MLIYDYTCRLKQESRDIEMGIVQLLTEAGVDMKLSLVQKF